MSILTNLLYWKIKKAGFTEKWTRVDQYKIYSVSKKGRVNSPWIVLLHGIGANLTHWHVVLSILNENGYNVLAFELPGHGKNQDLNESLTSRKLFDLCSKYLDVLDLGPMILVGNSLGGGVSLEYALRTPEKIRKLVLISPAVPFDEDQQLNELKKGLYLKSRSDAKVFLEKVYARAPKILPLIIASVIHDFNRKGVLDLLDTSTAEDSRGERDRAQLNVKTLLIWGKSEKLFKHDYLGLHKKRLPNHVIYEEPENIGHCPQLERPGWVAKRIESFIVES